MPILGIDHGEVRIGLAVSDDLGFLAHPVETVHRRNTPDYLGRIATIVRERKIETVVVGLPLRLDGSEGTAAAKVRAFIAELCAVLPEDIELVEIDERLSTVAAQAQLHAAGRNIRNSRSVIDQAAACVILQDYLDANAPPGEIDPDDETFEPQ